MNIRKVLAGSMAAIAAGATVAFGAFAQSSSLGDFVDNSGSTPIVPWIVIGSGNGNTAYANDVLGAADIAAAVAGFATRNVAVGGTAEVSVSGGVSLSTANTKIYGGDPINTAKDTLTSEDLPTILASGTFEDDDGNTYDYDQYIVVGDSTVALSNSGDDLDNPEVLIDMGTNSADPVYTMKVVFNDDLNFSDTNVDGNEINLFGTPYTVSSDSDTDTLVLFGGANKQTLTEGETATVDVGGVSYQVTLLGVSDEDTVVVKVNDQSRSIDAGQSRKIGGLDVFVDDVFYLSKESQVSSAKLSFGSSKITMDNGQEVEIGDTDSETVDNTLVTFTQGSTGTSVLEIAVAAQDDDADDITVGNPYTDPVFGTFKVAFGGGTPGLGEMQPFEFKTAGDDTDTVKMTDSKGNEKTIEWAFDPTPSTSGTTLLLESGDENSIVVVEGGTAAEDDYIVINQDDFSHLLQVTNIDLDATAGGSNDEGTLELKDVFTGTSYEVNMDEQTTATYFEGEKVIDGKTYYFWAHDTTTDVMAIVWGTGADADATTPSAGSVLSVFPTLMAVGGAEIAFVSGTVNVTSGAVGDTLEVFGIEYTLSNSTHDITNTGISVEYDNSTGEYTVEGVTGPSVALVEEEGEDTSGNDVRNVVIVEAGDNSDGITIQTGSTSPIFSGTATSWIDTEDSDIEVASDRYGTFVEKDTSDQGEVTIHYPDNQVVMAVGIGPSPVFSVSGESGTVKEAYQIMTPIAKLASEVSNPSALTKDVILVGGPCANSLVATLQDVSMDYPACAADFEGLTEGMIQEYDNAFNSGHKALVVAGTTGTNTRALATKVISGTLSYEN